MNAVFCAFVAMAVAGVFAADGDIGEACATGNACTSDLAICQMDMCKIKVASSCAGNTNQCVKDANCTSNVCVCTAPQTMAATVTADVGTCAITTGYVGAACAANNACMDSNAECDASMCKCKDGYAVNAMYGCDDSGAASVSASIFLMVAAIFVTSRFM